MFHRTLYDSLCLSKGKLWRVIASNVGATVVVSERASSVRNLATILYAKIDRLLQFQLSLKTQVMVK